ncbi:PadR family transcriptional regulator [Streptomyces spiralis]|uniref:PadR family transcriptional regulator n=1 Tax=Streptomyces spiralis TaxID=66376 RepID=UPI0033F66711
MLGLLSYAPRLTGYELKHWADHSLRFFYRAPAMSQIYTELQRLEELQWVESWTEPQDDVRTKRVYRVTSEGAAALRDHVESAPFRSPVVRNPVAMRVWLGRLTGGAGLVRLVDEFGAHLDELVHDITRALRAAEDDPDLAYAALALRWTARTYQAQADALQELRRELVQLVEQGPDDR